MKYGFFIFSFFNLINKILSFLRITLQISIIGDSILADGFGLASRTIAMARRITIDGNFETIIMTYYKTNNNSSSFAGKICLFILVIFGFVALIVFGFSSIIATLINIPEELYDIFVPCLRVLSFLIPLMFLMSFSSGILNANKRYIISAPAPFVGNIFNCAMLVFGVEYLGVFWGLTLSAILYSLIQVVFMMPFVMEYLSMPKDFTLNKEEKEFMIQSGNSAIWQNLAPLSDWYTHVLAARLSTGSFACMEYAHKIIQFIFSIIGVSLSSVLGPKLAGTKDFAKKTTEGFIISHILSIAPCIFVILYGEQIAFNVFSGVGKIKNVALLSKCISVCGVSLYFFIQTRILNTVVISKKYINISIISTVIFAVFNAVLSYMFSDSIINLSWGCNVAIMAQFVYLFIVLIYKQYIRFSIMDLFALLSSCITGFLVVLGTINSLGFIKNLCYGLTTAYPFFKSIVNVMDILLPFSLFYFIHLLLNYTHAKSLFED